MTVIIRTPVEGFSGEVAGVVFEDGVSVTEPDDLSYFERHSYLIEEPAKKPVRSKTTKEG